MYTAQPNSDLIWKLAGFQYREAAVDFLKRFEDSFCIFSGSVRQLYSNYEMRTTHEPRHSVVVLPNPYAFHDNFCNVPEAAVVPTGMVISPGEVRQSKDWILCYKPRGEKRWKGIEARKGFQKFQYRFGEDDPFLPVLLNSDLRRSSKDGRPLMHLHRVSLKKLDALSALQRGDIDRTIRDKLSSFRA